MSDRVDIRHSYNWHCGNELLHETSRGSYPLIGRNQHVTSSARQTASASNLDLSCFRSGARSGGTLG